MLILCGLAEMLIPLHLHDRMSITITNNVPPRLRGLVVLCRHVVLLLLHDCSIIIIIFIFVVVVAITNIIFV